MMTYFKNQWFKQPVQAALSIGCGFGIFEREAVRHKLADKLEGVDISEGAIASCVKKAAEDGMSDSISYRVADCNALILPRGQYDAVFGMGSIHHIEKLENLYEQIARTLKPGGLFCMNEYVGPARFKVSPLVHRYINGLLRMLPDDKRRYVRNPSEIKTKWEPPTPAWFEKNDPSEAVRSADIVPLLADRFEIVGFQPFGGTILHHLFAGIAGNFHEDDPEDCAFIDLCIDAEERLEQAGLVQSDFAVIVCRVR